MFGANKGKGQTYPSSYYAEHYVGKQQVPLKSLVIQRLILWSLTLGEDALTTGPPRRYTLAIQNSLLLYMNVASKGLSWDTKMTCEIIWSLVVRWVVLMGTCSLILSFILLLRWNVCVNYFQSGPHRCSCCQTSYLVPGRCSTVHRGTVLTSCLVFCRPARPCSVSTENTLPTRVKMTAFSFNRRYDGKSSGK